VIGVWKEGATKETLVEGDGEAGANNGDCVKTLVMDCRDGVLEGRSDERDDTRDERDMLEVGDGDNNCREDVCV